MCIPVQVAVEYMNVDISTLEVYVKTRIHILLPPSRIRDLHDKK